MRLFAITKADGGVAIMRLYNDAATPEAEVARYHPDQQALFEQPLQIREITESDIPERDEYRDDWEDTGSAIATNMAKARARFDAMVRDAKLAKARELRAREDIGENVAAERAQLQATNPNSSAASTPAALKALWPPGLDRR